MSEAPAVLEWDLADRMRKALRVSGWSVHEMSEYLGVAPNTVSTWINGRNRPSPSTIRLWAMRCGVPYEWLLGEGLRRAPIRRYAAGAPDCRSRRRWSSTPKPADIAADRNQPQQNSAVSLYRRSGLGLAA